MGEIDKSQTFPSMIYDQNVDLPARVSKDGERRYLEEFHMGDFEDAGSCSALYSYTESTHE
jgi:hypothetical protein